MDTSIVLTAAKLQLSIPVALKLFDSLFPAAEIKFEVHGTNYSQKRVRPLWLWKHVEGAKFSLTIKGRPSFCQIAAANLVMAATNLSQLELRSLPEIIRDTQAHADGVKSYGWGRMLDIFRFENSMQFEIQGSKFQRTTSWFWEEESGAFCRLTIRGKPRFCEAMSGYIGSHGPSLLSLLLSTDLSSEGRKELPV